MKFMIFIIIVSSLCLTTVAFANKVPINLACTDEIIYADQLYLTDGEGDYTGYKKLNGYPLQDQFQVYIQENGTSHHAIFKDLRGIDLDELIEWNDEGMSKTSTRRDLYHMFSDIVSQPTNFSRITGKFSQDWLNETFGKVYSDWITGQAFSQDANNLVEKYFEFKSDIKPINRFELADIKI